MWVQRYVNLFTKQVIIDVYNNCKGVACNAPADLNNESVQQIIIIFHLNTMGSEQEDCLPPFP
jgi:hypothetical protein